MSKFGWSYPAGCSGPPEPPEPHPLGVEVCELLEQAGVDQAVIDRVCMKIEELASAAEAECPHCLQRQEEMLDDANARLIGDDSEHSENGGI